jgi:hypothetical protein
VLQALEQIADALHSTTAPQPESLLKQPSYRPRQIAVPEEIIYRFIEHLIGLDIRKRLPAVPL